MIRPGPAGILRTEEALTRVQAQKGRLIEQLHKIEMDEQKAKSGDGETAKKVEFYIVE